MRTYIGIFVLLQSLLFLGCKEVKPESNEIFGTWESNQGAVIQLKPDNSVMVKKYPLNLNNSNFKGVLNGTGTWKLYKNEMNKWWVIEMSVNSDKFIPELQDDGIMVELFVNNKEFFGDKPKVKNLFRWKGDPDSDVRYVFEKKEK